MLAGQDHADAHDHAQDEPDHETKARRILERALAEIEHARWFVFVHAPECVSGFAACKP